MNVKNLLNLNQITDEQVKEIIEEEARRLKEYKDTTSRTYMTPIRKEAELYIEKLSGIKYNKVKYKLNTLKLNLYLIASENNVSLLKTLKEEGIDVYALNNQKKENQLKEIQAAYKNTEKKSVLEALINSKELLTLGKIKTNRLKRMLWVLEGISLPRHIHKKINTNVKNNKLDQLKNTIHVDKKQYLSTANKLIESNIHTKICVGLIALTGRRSIEILKTGEFVEDHGSLIFRGIAKKRKNKNKEITIPCLGDPKKVIRSLKKLRIIKDFSKKTNAQVSDQTSSNLSRMVKKEFKDIIPNIQTKTMRSIYAAICLENLPNKLSSEVYLSKILGHEENDLNTQIHYKNIKVF